MRLRMWSFVLSAVCFSGGLVQAAWNTNPTNYTLIGNRGTSDLPSLTVVPDGQAGAYMVWVETNYYGGIYTKVMAQRVTKQGDIAWTAWAVQATTSTNWQSAPVATVTTDGYLAVGWQQRIGAYNVFYLQRINRDGERAFDEGLRMTPLTSSAINLRLAPGPSGRILACWQDNRNSSAHIYSIYADSVPSSVWDAATPVARSGYKISEDTSAFRSNPRIVPRSDGGGIVAWEYKGLTALQSELMTARFQQNGSVPWRRYVQFGADADMVSDDSDGCVLAFNFISAGGSTGQVYAAHVNQAGVVKWQLNPFSSGLNAHSPRIVQSADSNVFVIAKNPTVAPSPSIPNARDLLVNRINVATSNRVWSNTGNIYSYGVIDQHTPYLAFRDNADGLVLAWLDWRAQPTSYHYYAQRLDLTATPFWTDNGITVGVAQTNRPFAGAAVGKGGYLVGWCFRASPASLHIRANRIKENGSLGGPSTSLGGIPLLLFE